MKRLIITTKTNESYRGNKKEEILSLDNELEEFLKEHSEISEDEIKNVGWEEV